MTEKSNSLSALGYVIEPQTNAKDEAGLEIVAVVYKPIYIKRTKRNKLKAYKALNDKVETTVEGLYNFELQNNDLVGKRLQPATPAATLVTA